MESHPPKPGVKIPPPSVFLLGLGVAWVLETRVRRIHLTGDAPAPVWLQTLGLAILAAGLALMLWGFFTFLRVGTGIVPHRPATRIVGHGPYRFTRNPMYVGMAAAYVGGALITNSGWALIIFPLVMLALYNLVVSREEIYLSAAFPEEYGAYRKKVRRWL